MRDPNLTSRARRLRRDATDAERYLWSRLRARQLLGFKFHRQFQIGPFIADFCCRSARLVVELDGEQHFERRAADLERSTFLAEQGYRVIRFWNHEVLREIERVLETILQALEKIPKASSDDRPASRSRSD
jgi:very-short-patch-repair endonuclease